MMLFSEFVLVNLMMRFLGESKALAKKTGITFTPPRTINRPQGGL